MSLQIKRDSSCQRGTTVVYGAAADEDDGEEGHFSPFPPATHFQL